MIKKSL